MISEYLHSLIPPDLLARAEQVAASSGRPLGEVLTRMGALSEQALAEAYGRGAGLDLLAPGELADEPVFAGEVNAVFLRASRIVPLAVDAGTCRAALADPTNTQACRAFEAFVGMPVTYVVGTISEIDRALERLYPDAPGGGETSPEELSSAHVSDDVDRLKDLASEAPVIRLVNRIITAAIEAGATDIHIEPSQSQVRVRERVDGLLRDVESLPLAQGPAIVSRIKILAGLDIAERRLAQDGRIRLAVKGQNVDFRVSTVPTVFGESAALRILDQTQVRLDFSVLGFSPAQLDTLKALLAEPHGILLVTGPTGSGKTTTLYTCLDHLNVPETKILTVEDPIEYMLDGINQVQVHPAIGLTFASALRSFLRQDPDILMVGEIRDSETAQVAVQAALTGHLVLSTLHTNDAVSALTRLLDMGVEDFLLTSTIRGIVAQRLVRRLCAECREASPPDAGQRALLEKQGIVVTPHTRLYHAKGCAACGERGFKGRTAIAEVLPLNEAIRSLVLARAELPQLRAAAKEAGMASLFASGIAKAMDGETTLEEVLRVTRDV